MKRLLGFALLLCSAHAAQGEKAKGPSIFFGATGTEIVAAKKGWVKRKDGSQIRMVSNPRKGYGAVVELRRGQATLRIDHTGDGLADKQLILKHGPFDRKLDRAAQGIAEELLFGVMGRLERIGLGIGGLATGILQRSHSILVIDLGKPFRFEGPRGTLRGFGRTGMLLGAGGGRAPIGKFSPRVSYAMDSGDALGRIVDVAYQMYEVEGARMTGFGATTDDSGTTGYVAEFQDPDGVTTVVAFDADGEPYAANRYESTEPEQKEEEKKEEEEPKEEVPSEDEEDDDDGEDDDDDDDDPPPPPPPQPSSPAPKPTTTPNPEDPRDDEAALATLHPLLQAVVRSMFPLPNLQDPKSHTMQPNPSAENGGGPSRPSGVKSVDRKAPYVQPNPAEEGRRGTHAGNAKRPQVNSKTPIINPGFGETP